MKIFAAPLARAAALSLLLAPAQAPAAAPALRYSVSGGVVKDNKTGLYWQQADSPMLYGFSDAITYCSGNAGGLSGTGWRLPTIKELQTLVDDSVASPGPTIDASAFPGAFPNLRVWSSTPYNMQPSTFVWIVFFYDGSTSTGYLDTKYGVRCVR